MLRAAAVQPSGGHSSPANPAIRAGGLCYLTVPSRGFPFETHPIKLCKRLLHPKWFPLLPYVPPLHSRLATARVFTARGIQRLTARAGFLPARISYIMPPLERVAPGVGRLLQGFEGLPGLRALGVSLVAVLQKPHHEM